MFSSCSGLISLDLSNFDTSKVTNMSYMFFYSRGLTSLDLSNFNTSAVTDMTRMFNGCSNLTSVTFGLQADVSKVTSYSDMFYGITTTGTLYYDGDYDFSKIIEVKPSTWDTYHMSSPFTFVDLELPSGLLWATCNVGATKPGEYGLYFAWGETQGYTGVTNEKEFDWKHYGLATGVTKDVFAFTQTGGKLTKYVSNSSYGTIDNKSSLDSEDDAVYNINKFCRMPTRSELDELVQNTTQSLTTNNGVYCVKFTSNTSSGKKSILIPTGGYYVDTTLNSEGELACIWSKTGNDDTSHCGQFDSNYAARGQVERCKGYNIRAVKETK